MSRGSVKVVSIIEQLRESRHVKERSEEFLGSRVFNLEMESKRRAGRLKTRWMEVIQMDCLAVK